jgi:hypothetical protein
MRLLAIAQGALRRAQSPSRKVTVEGYIANRLKSPGTCPDDSNGIVYAAVNNMTDYITLIGLLKR